VIDQSLVIAQAKVVKANLAALVGLLEPREA
jgi:hypothetical protein